MANLKQILLTIRSGGLHHSLKILSYTLFKNRLDRAYTTRIEPSGVLPVGNLVRAIQQSAGGKFIFDQATLEVYFLAPDLVRLSWQPGTPPPAYALVWGEQPEPEISFYQDSQSVMLKSSALQVEVKIDGRVNFLLPDGSVLRQELTPRREGEAWTSRYLPAQDEILYGMGLHSGPFDLRARLHRLWGCDAGGNYEPNHDPLYMPLPVYMSVQARGSHLVFYENSFKGAFTPDDLEASRSAVEMEFSGGMLRYYLIIGAPPDILERFSALTGRAPLPPLWALGYHQSRWGYKDEREIRAVASGFQEHDLPISAIHLDLDHLNGGRPFSFNPQLFSDVPALTRDLKQQGIHLVTILDPGVNVDAGFDMYRDGLQRGAFCRLPDGNPLAGILWMGRCHYPDFTDPAVRDWWGSYYPRTLDRGVRGFWHDMNEPTSFVAWGEYTFPLATRHALETSPGDHLQARNLYGFQMNRSGYEALRKHAPQLRPWILSRSGWVGSQRYAWSWTADSSTRWESMRMNLTSALSLSLCGFPYCGPDIGGFSGNPSAELYTRWFQMAAFMPFFRTHSSIATPPREPWVFGEPYASILRNYLKLRYRLLPYFYTLAWQHTQDGSPIMRPLFWADWQDTRLWGLDDAFLLGESLLVAPVFEPGAVQRAVTLPTGGWYDFWRGSSLPTTPPGADPIDLPAPLERLPLLVRAGTVLPMIEENSQSPTASFEGAELGLHLFPGGPLQVGIGKLYSDAGDGYGSSRLDTFILSWEDARLLLTWEADGDYPFPYKNLALHLHGYHAIQAWVDGERIPATGLRAVNRPFERVLIEVG